VAAKSHRAVICAGIPCRALPGSFAPRFLHESSKLDEIETAAIHQSASGDICGKACGEYPTALRMQGAISLFQKPCPASLLFVVANTSLMFIPVVVSKTDVLRHT
jgi:hypothetical protein